MYFGSLESVIKLGCANHYEPGHAEVRNNPWNLWLKTTKVYFLFVLHMLHSLPVGSTGPCYQRAQANRGPVSMCTPTVRHQDDEAMAKHVIFLNASRQK